LHDLQAAKLIKRVNDTPQAHKKRDAAVFRFTLPPVHLDTVYTTGSYSVSKWTPQNTPQMDVFGKLGAVSFRVWQHLLTTYEPSISAIARALALPRSSVSRAVKILQPDYLTMIGRGADGHYYGEPKTDASLQYLAALLHNGASPTANKKNGHRIEREQHNNRLVIGAIRYWEARQ
jgi:hypothetical protein